MTLRAPSPGDRPAAPPGGDGRPAGLARDSMAAQFLWYLVVGGLSFLADLAAFLLLLDRGAPVMAALVAGFAVGTAANYLLSLAMAFTGGRHGRGAEIGWLVAVALTGLALTLALVWAFMTFAGMSAVAAKIAATLIALAWNYLGRRLLVFRPEMPGRTWRLSSRISARFGRPRAGDG